MFEISLLIYFGSIAGIFVTAFFAGFFVGVECGRKQQKGGA